MHCVSCDKFDSKRSYCSILKGEIIPGDTFVVDPNGNMFRCHQGIQYHDDALTRHENLLSKMVGRKRR